MTQANSGGAPRVSVVIPVYNVQDYVAIALDSVLAQTFTDFEVIVVDDGGSDGSMQIVGRYDDPRIRIHTKPNGGLNSARNAGIRAARGAFIAFLDADDVWAPEKLARHVAHLDARPAVGVSYSPSRLVDGAGRPLGLSQSPKLTGVTKKDVLCRNPIGNGSAGVFRRKVFDDIAFRRAETPEGEVWWFDQTFRQSTDIECWMRIVAQTDWGFEGVPEALTDYRVNDGGLSANTARQLENWEKALAAMAALAPDLAAQWGGLARAYQYRYLARRGVSLRDGAGAWANMRRALGQDWRILTEEPAKTLSTLAAAALLRALPRSAYERIERLARAA